MRNHEKRAVESEVYIDTTCDACGQVICQRGDKDPIGGYEIFAGHHSWGEDSHESWESTDACSIACLAEVLKQEFLRIRGETAPFVQIRMHPEQAVAIAEALFYTAQCIEDAKEGAGESAEPLQNSCVVTDPPKDPGESFTSK